MKKIIMTLTLAVSMFVPGLTSHAHAAGPGVPDMGQTAASKANTNDNLTKAPEAPKANQEKEGAEEAKKIIVARVNGADINMFMLTRAMNRVAPKYIKEGEATSPETTGKIRKEALDRLIVEELAVQDARRLGINPAPEAIEKVMNEVRKNLGTEDAYREYLEKNGLTEDVMKKLIERSQRLELITAREVYGKVRVDEKLLHEEYEKEKGRYILPENFVVTDVWFVKGKDEAAREHADNVLKNIKAAGNDTDKLVLDGTFVVRKINIKREKYTGIYKAMADMKVGDLNGLIDERDGFHIIKIMKKEPSRAATYEEAKPSIKTKFLYPAQEEMRQQWQKDLREHAKIEIMQDDVNNSGQEKK